MPMTDKDIRQLFELDGAAVRWREVPTAGLPALFLRAAQKHNQKAGAKVQFWSGSGNSKMVTVAGVAVTVDRIMKVLGAKQQREARRAEQVAAKPQPQPQANTAKPWSDPSDPKPVNDAKALASWLGREADRREAWQAKHGESQ